MEEKYFLADKNSFWPFILSTEDFVIAFGCKHRGAPLPIIFYDLNKK